MDRSKFISKDALKLAFQSPQAKFVINAWLMTKSQNQFIDDFQDQYLVDVYGDEINSFDSIEDIINDIFKYVDKITMPSKLSTWIANFHSSEQLNLVCHKWLEERPLLSLPNFTYSEESLTLMNGAKPSLATLYYMNVINAQLTGYYLENILAYCIYNDVELWRQKESKEVTVQILNQSDSLTITDSDITVLKHRCSNENGFKSLPHELLYLTFVQAINKKLTGSAYTSFFKLADFIDDEVYNASICRYIDELSKCSYVQSLQKFKNENFHSISVYKVIDGKYISGELDFMFPNSIVDAKCTRSPHIAQWAAQLYVYKLLTNHQANNLAIVSFLNNTVYKFNF